MTSRTAPRHLAALAWLPVVTQLAGLGCGDTLIDVLVPADAGPDRGSGRPGGCDDECDDGDECHDSACGCVPPEVSCGESCVDLRSDDEHCGDCDVRCRDHTWCVDGTCQ
ncbi:hypothetical protein [Sorangium sp. So ce131]|uniref:hypothetical protein n=1 Tax=Sorangium sp. So ce131 TaxID=3133282 RepID=UPI003F614C74